MDIVMYITPRLSTARKPCTCSSFWCGVVGVVVGMERAMNVTHERDPFSDLYKGNAWRRYKIVVPCYKGGD
jgi:hypothetical protein